MLNERLESRDQSSDHRYEIQSSFSGLLSTERTRGTQASYELGIKAVRKRFEDDPTRLQRERDGINYDLILLIV